ncbi:signal peptidase I [uncultured Erythrobacter sp.]|uniref:signal peptidase I n=1 Tax=uncultured Erythrobacter sp. TaxID=263913 RepID=UPI0026226B15|nr:signal peptidase I [uncultured Erythrobacter sp.]
MNVTTESDTLETQQSGATESAEKEESWTSFGLFLLKLLLAVLIFRSFIFSPFSIPSESMMPRLWNGDYLLAAKWPYGFSKHSLPFSAPLIPGRLLAGQPERGDVVIFKHPIDETDYIKRVIALPGDTVGVIGGEIVLNGEIVPREEIGDFEIPVSINTSCAWGAEATEDAEGNSVCKYRQFRETLPNGRSYNVLDFGLTRADGFAPVMVPEGRMFVMGDNRDNSKDSRFRAASGGGVGLVPQDLLVAEATIIMWSTDGSAEWIKPWTWFTAARWDRLGETL